MARDSKTSRFRVPLQQTLADAKLDVERAQLRLSAQRAPNVFLAPIIAGVVIALFGSLFALSAALRARENAEADLSPANSERMIDVEVQD